MHPYWAESALYLWSRHCGVAQGPGPHNRRYTARRHAHRRYEIRIRVRRPNHAHAHARTRACAGSETVVAVPPGGQEDPTRTDGRRRPLKGGTGGGTQMSCIWDASPISRDARYLSHLDVLSPWACEARACRLTQLYVQFPRVCKILLSLSRGHGGVARTRPMGPIPG